MDVYATYRALNKNVLDILQNTNKLEPIQNEKVVDYVRVEESPFELTQDTVLVVGKVVTIHNLQQYRNDFHKLTVDEDLYCVLQVLLEIDNEEELC